jgi:hypothetical protein
MAKPAKQLLYQADLWAEAAELCMLWPSELGREFIMAMSMLKERLTRTNYRMQLNGYEGLRAHWNQTQPFGSLYWIH